MDGDAVIRAAIEVARCAPGLADATDDEIARTLDGGGRYAYLGSGERAVVELGAAVERFFACCDRETRADVLDVLDRLQAVTL